MNYQEERHNKVSSSSTENLQWLLVWWWMSLLSLSQSKEGDMSLLLLTSRKTKRVPNQYITRCLIHWNLSFVRKWRSEAEEFQWEKNDQHHESEREETIETIISPSNKETDCTSSFKISKSFGTEKHHLFIHAISLMHCVYRFLTPQRTDLLKETTTVGQLLQGSLLQLSFDLWEGFEESEGTTKRTSEARLVVSD